MVILLARSYLKKYPWDGSATTEPQDSFQLDFQESAGFSACRSCWDDAACSTSCWEEALKEELFPRVLWEAFMQRCGHLQVQSKHLCAAAVVSEGRSDSEVNESR